MALLKAWFRHLLKDKTVFIIGSIFLSLWTVVVWVLSKYFGEQTPYYFDWTNLVEWVIIYTAILTSTFVTKYLVGSKIFLSNAWYIATASYIGSVIGGVFIDLFFVWIAPLFGIAYDVTLVYTDIEIQSAYSHTVQFMVLGIFIALVAAQMQITRYKQHLQNRLNESERENLKQLNELNQLKAVQARVNPHFLYNSLNSVASLIRKKPSDAEEMVVKLSELFRYQIIPLQAELVQLKEELEVVETYLEIEKIRFGSQLNYNLNVDSHCLQVSIPRLLLQPIVENAIKHGTSKVELGEINISITCDNQILTILIEDNGPDFNPSPNIGTGISNIQKLLTHYYANNYSFELLSTPKKVVVVKIPFEQ